MGTRQQTFPLAADKFYEITVLDMKVNELMIGDWVLTLDSTHEKKVFAQVDAIEEGKHSILVTKECSNWFVDIDWIEPIPLTSEILARMGFTIEEEPKYDDTYTEDEYIATMKCVDSRKCEVEIEYNTYWKELRAFNYDPHNRLGFTSIETQIMYVHELQHIMCLCGI